MPPFPFHFWIKSFNSLICFFAFLSWGGWKVELSAWNSSKFLNAYLAVSLHLHHWLLKTWSILILFFLNNFPIFFDWSIPSLLRFLWVLQSLIWKPEGSPLPGAIECLIRITLLPSFAGCQSARAVSYTHLTLPTNREV